MFEYSICNQADEEIFVKQCSALEKHIPGLVKKDLSTDVDNSKVQEYTLGDAEITVHNDYYINEVVVKSEIELEHFFINHSRP